MFSNNSDILQADGEHGLAAKCCANALAKDQLEIQCGAKLTLQKDY